MYDMGNMSISNVMKDTEHCLHRLLPPPSCRYQPIAFRLDWVLEHSVICTFGYQAPRKQTKENSISSNQISSTDSRKIIIVGRSACQILPFFLFEATAEWSSLVSFIVSYLRYRCS